jgi:hypothetical protein
MTPVFGPLANVIEDQKERTNMKALCKSAIDAAFLIVCAVHLNAGSVGYDISFTPLNGVVPTAGFFDYNAAAPAFTNFTVTWDGILFDLTSAANNFVPTPGCNDPSGAAGAFEILSHTTTSCIGVSAWIAFFPGTPESSGLGFSQLNGPGNISEDVLVTGTNPGIDASGHWTITATPEPSTGGLAVGGVIALWAMWRRTLRRRSSLSTS